MVVCLRHQHRIASTTHRINARRSNTRNTISTPYQLCRAEDDSNIAWSPDTYYRHVLALIQTRQTILPKRLRAPGPDAAQTQAILASAAHAPDHHELLTWRLIVVPVGARVTPVVVLVGVVVSGGQAWTIGRLTATVSAGEHEFGSS